MDISTFTTDRSVVDSALHVCFAPSSIKQLLVVTSTSRLVKLDSQNGVLLSEVCMSIIASHNKKSCCCCCALLFFILSGFQYPSCVYELLPVASKHKGILKEHDLKLKWYQMLHDSWSVIWTLVYCNTNFCSQNRTLFVLVYWVVFLIHAYTVCKDKHRNK